MIEQEHQGPTTVMRLASGRGNAMNVEFLQAFSATLEELAARPSTRAVVLTSAGPILSAGVDLPTVLAGKSDYLREFLPVLDHFFAALVRFPKPLIAAVSGHAIAGGCVAVLACDWRVMSSGKPLIGLTELAVGVPFPTPVMELIRERVPSRYLREILYGARNYPATEALERGLIDEVTDAEQTLPRALEVAATYGAIEPEAFRITKQQLQQPIIDRWQRYAPQFDEPIRQAWAADSTLAAIGQFVAARIRK